MRVKVPPEELVVHLCSYGSRQYGQPTGWSLPERSPVWPGCKLTGRNASELWANPERLLWMPTRSGRGEGRRMSGRPTITKPGMVHRGKSRRHAGKDIVATREVRRDESWPLSTVPQGGRSRRMAEGTAVPAKSGKPDGGKGPWFGGLSKQSRMEEIDPWV